jgi:hypothetical protein
LNSSHPEETSEIRALNPEALDLHLSRFHVFDRLDVEPEQCEIGIGHILPELLEEGNVFRNHSLGLHVLHDPRLARASNRALVLVPLDHHGEFNVVVFLELFGLCITRASRYPELILDIEHCYRTHPGFFAGAGCKENTRHFVKVAPHFLL